MELNRSFGVWVWVGNLLNSQRLLIRPVDWQLYQLGFSGCCRKRWGGMWFCWESPREEHLAHCTSDFLPVVWAHIPCIVHAFTFGVCVCVYTFLLSGSFQRWCLHTQFPLHPKPGGVGAKLWPTLDVPPAALPLLCVFKGIIKPWPQNRAGTQS